ncbi:hypothetical protein [Cellulomonas sp. S1-8]|uniref:hypothetical protein n=1 Tax=Cellulomonas sp. S1-8 TaxID=2904790 RepID=UPI002244731B|nr:hypothetical protein [Cellulomonas sp. S1-8]UZN03746.1 hypothetical protein OKX07_02035 [Cellulomonas sp. S1-8]
MSDRLRAHPEPRYARGRGAPAARRSTSGSWAADLPGLPRDAGNAAVTRALAPSGGAAAAARHVAADDGAGATHRAGELRTTVSVDIRREPQRPDASTIDGDTPRTPRRRWGATADHDASEEVVDDGVSAEVVDAALLAQVVVPTEVEPGQTVRLPDMVVPGDLLAPEQDTIGAAITYAPTLAQSGAVSPFGSTRWSTFSITGTTVTPSPGAYSVSFTLVNPITYNVASGGKTDIPSETSAAITHANFATVASDLTPNMGDLGGRPPRTQFWAEDLTLRHENFHARERQGFATTGAQVAQAWLSSQTATSIVDIVRLVAQVPGRVIASSQAAAGDLQTKESRAYGDGLAAYRGRADAVRARGASGSYPGAPPPPAPPAATP